MKYKVGTKWIFTNTEGEKYLCEVLSHNDDKIIKVKLPNDVCMYFTELGWGSTYDAKFLDQYCVEA